MKTGNVKNVMNKTITVKVKYRNMKTNCKLPYEQLLNGNDYYTYYKGNSGDEDDK